MIKKMSTKSIWVVVRYRMFICAIIEKSETADTSMLMLWLLEQFLISKRLPIFFKFSRERILLFTWMVLV